MKKEVTKLLIDVTGLVLYKQREFRRAIARVICCKQFKETEQELTKALIPFFQEQIKETKKRLSELSDSKTVSDQAANITKQIYDPLEWRGKLIDKALPVLSRAMGEAATAQILQAPNELRKSTASEWLDQEGLEDDELPPGLTTEFPSWMRDAIEVSLRETFEQDYWVKILETSGGDIEGFILHGVQEGWSIQKMASEISSAFPLGYSRRRATVIARTESANSLSAARSLAIDHLKEESGESGQFIKKSWLSVLSNTTRDSHAALDGAVEDENGMFNLSGFEIPWPAHYSLPVEERANCLCSLTTEFGI